MTWDNSSGAMLVYFRINEEKAHKDKGIVSIETAR
jgi:hypothetical protein